MSLGLILEILTFLFSSNFYANAAIFGIAIFCICLYLNKWKIEESTSLVFIMVAGISYFFIYSINYGFPPIRVLFSRMVGPIMLFISGCVIGKFGKEHLEHFSLILVFGMASHGILNFIININTNIITSVGRGMKDVWGGVIAATGQNLLMAMVTALLFYFAFCCKRKLIQILGLVTILLSIIGTFINGSRTLLYIVVISFACMIIYFLVKTRSVTKKIRIITAASFAIGIGVFVLATDFMGISDWINSSGLFMRYAGNESKMMTQTGRSALSAYVITHFLDYPLGNMPVSNYAHNLWLDIGIEVGWIPTIFHVLFCLNAIIEFVKFGLKKNESLNVQILLLSLFLVMMMEFFIEPVLMGNPYFYMCFCFLVGGITSLNKKLMWR